MQSATNRCIIALELQKLRQTLGKTFQSSFPFPADGKFLMTEIQWLRDLLKATGSFNFSIMNLRKNEVAFFPFYRVSRYQKRCLL